MPDKITADQLAGLELFADENREAIEWIAGKMQSRSYATGDPIFTQGDPARDFVIVMSGEVHFRREGADDIFIVTAGEATGVLPFSRMKTWGGRGWAAQDTVLGIMDISNHRELVYRAPLLAQRLVGQMTDRAREFTRMGESSNRLHALGKLAAGLAHELNNPASAAVRSSSRLRDVLTERRKISLAMRGEVLAEAARELITDLGASLVECSEVPDRMDALERADAESDLADWLEASGAPGELASSLVDACITAERLRPLQSLLTPHTFALGLKVLVADHEILCLTRELEEAARRISDLVHAVKSYSYMDQSPMSEVDLEQGIEVTIRMFQHQLKHGVKIDKQFARNLPRIRANGSALNQIWTNLIDNALDAMCSMPDGEQKILTVKTCLEPSGVLVEIGDNGPGIPEDVQGRMFEPFFTTKPVGEGTGLGLDIVQRIVKSHRGSIRVESVPGKTFFQVRLPVEPPPA